MIRLKITLGTALDILNLKRRTLAFQNIKVTNDAHRLTSHINQSDEINAAKSGRGLNNKLID